MDSRRFILKQTGILAVGQLLCIALMLGTMALLGHWDVSVWLGGICGGILALANFFVMAVCADMAADKAEAQNPKAGQALIRVSYFGRLAVIAVVLFALVKSGVCHVVPAVLPLAFNRPILTLVEYFRKGSKKA